MLVAAWTNGAAIEKPTGEPMDTTELKRLRERMRNRLGPDEQRGGLSLDDMARAVEMTWPALPMLPRWTANQDLSFDEIWARLGSGSVAVLNGNPSKCRSDSPLRSWTYNDAFGHAIYVDRVSKDGDRAYVMDPLGRAGYDGQWVAKADLAAFLSAYGGPHDRAVSVVRRGGAEKFLRPAAEPIAPADTGCDELTRRVAELEGQLAEMRAWSERLTARLEALRARRKTAEADAKAQRARADGLAAAVADAMDALRRVAA